MLIERTFDFFAILWQDRLHEDLIFGESVAEMTVVMAAG